MSTPYCNFHKQWFDEIGEFVDSETKVIITIFKSPCCGSYMIRPLSVEIGQEEQNLITKSQDGKGVEK